MKVLIVLCAVVAVSVAKPGYLGAGIVAPGIVGAHALGYAAPAVAVAHAVPAADAVPAGLALTPNGVPVDTPAVQAGHVANAVAHANANGLTVATAAARGAYYGAPALGYAAGIVGAHGIVGAPALGYAAPGVVAAHGIVGAHALGYAAPAVAVAHAVPAADVVPAGLVLTPNGVPVDTPAVQAARAADAAAHLNAKGLILG